MDTFKISNANRICIPNPFITNVQLISFLFLLNKKAINKREISPKIPLEIEEKLIPDVATVVGVITAFLKA